MHRKNRITIQPYVFNKKDTKAILAIYVDWPSSACEARAAPHIIIFQMAGAKIWHAPPLGRWYLLSSYRDPLLSSRDRRHRKQRLRRLHPFKEGKVSATSEARLCSARARGSASPDSDTVSEACSNPVIHDGSVLSHTGIGIIYGRFRAVLWLIYQTTNILRHIFP